jgi:hypothetical protein
LTSKYRAAELVEEEMERPKTKANHTSTLKFVLENSINQCIVDMPYQLPKIQLQHLSPLPFYFSIDGPDSANYQQRPEYGSVCYYNSISTYPWIAAENRREGDPICDHFSLALAPNCFIFTICDGCSW